MAYRDEENNSNATVRKFDGTNWVNVGGTDFSAGPVWFVSLAFNSSGQPYVAYSDEANAFKATVMTFDGTNWTDVGIAAFSEGSVYNTVLAINPSGQPFVGYSDWGNGEKASVMRYGSPSAIDNMTNAFISVYPNPAATTLTIDLNGYAPGMRYLGIYDMTGKTLFETQTDLNKVLLNVEDYPAGFYFIKVKSNSLNYTGKFLKDHN